MGDRTVTATLNNSEAARDLVAMLPVSIHMRDHLRREKTGRIPGPLSEAYRGEPDLRVRRLGLLAAGRRLRDLFTDTMG